MRGALWHRGLRKGNLEFSLMTGFRTLPGIAGCLVLFYTSRVICQALRLIPHQLEWVISAIGNRSPIWVIPDPKMLLPGVFRLSASRLFTF